MPMGCVVTTATPNQTSTLPLMRGLLVVNPNATTTTPRAREVLINSLTYQFHLETITTDHRGHAAELGARARRDGVDAVIALGGDGTANEIINGMLGEEGPGPDVPAFGIVPGGSANVFSPLDRVSAGSDRSHGRTDCCAAGSPDAHNRPRARR